MSFAVWMKWMKDRNEQELELKGMRHVLEQQKVETTTGDYVPFDRLDSSQLCSNSSIIISWVLIISSADSHS
jgi:hypothetical protein